MKLQTQNSDSKEPPWHVTTIYCRDTTRHNTLLHSFDSHAHTRNQKSDQEHLVQKMSS